MKNRLEKILTKISTPSAASTETEERFVQIPAIFYKDKSSEQFTAMQQIYREAYEKAIRQQQQQHDDFDLNLGDGI